MTKFSIIWPPQPGSGPNDDTLKLHQWMETYCYVVCSSMSSPMSGRSWRYYSIFASCLPERGSTLSGFRERFTLVWHFQQLIVLIKINFISLRSFHRIRFYFFFLLSCVLWMTTMITGLPGRQRWVKMEIFFKQKVLESWIRDEFKSGWSCPIW